MRTKLPALFAVMVVLAIVGASWLSWNHWVSTRPLKSIRVVLFDSADNPHPSPKDSSWDINDPQMVAKIGTPIRSARRGQAGLSIAASGCLELTDERGRMERFFILMVRREEGLSLYAAEDWTSIAPEDDKALLRNLEVVGVPMERFFYHDPPK